MKKKIPVPNLVINPDMEETKELVDAIMNLTDSKNNEMFVEVLEKIGRS